MVKRLEEIFLSFRGCFSREAAFGWFVVVIVGFMVRSDQLGITSIVRDLALSERSYEPLLHFFHASSWTLDGVRSAWWGYLAAHAPLYRVRDRCVLVGDGVKQAKEAYYMAGVKKMVQESEDSSKAEYIFGHLFGAVGLLAGSKARKFSIPLKINLQDGLQPAAAWNGSGISPASHVIQMVECGFAAAQSIGKSYLLLDRYFLSRPALSRLAELNSTAGERVVEIITKAKRGCVAYTKPAKPDKPRKGAPRKRGDAVHLADLFDKRKDKFVNRHAFVYGTKREVSYYSADLLWGQGLYMELRFVLVEMGGVRSILVSTDLSLSPVKIIELYAKRFSIETMFRDMKQNLGGFKYHFWTRALPKLRHFKKREDPNPLDCITDEKSQRKILGNIKAIEGYVLFASIAMGCLQLIALETEKMSQVASLRYLRTKSSVMVSEATIMYYLRRHIFLMLSQNPSSFITRYICSRQPGGSVSIEKEAA